MEEVYFMEMSEAVEENERTKKIRMSEDMRSRWDKKNKEEGEVVKEVKEKEGWREEGK